MKQRVEEIRMRELNELLHVFLDDIETCIRSHSLFLLCRCNVNWRNQSEIRLRHYFKSFVIFCGCVCVRPRLRRLHQSILLTYSKCVFGLQTRFFPFGYRYLQIKSQFLVWTVDTSRLVLNSNWGVKASWNDSSHRECHLQGLKEHKNFFTVT